MNKLPILVILLFMLSGCGTCMFCNGKFFDPNAAENYKKRVAAEKVRELQQCKDWNYKPGTSEFLDCIEMFDKKRSQREADSLKRSQAIGSAFGNMGKQLRNQRRPQPTMGNQKAPNLGMYERSYQKGMNTVCVYSEGSFTLDGIGICPF